MVKEALRSKALTHGLRYGRQGFQWLTRHTPKLLKGKASVPLRNAGGSWTQGTGKLLENLGKFGGKHVKGERALGFFGDLSDLGRQASRFGTRQRAISDQLWNPSNYKGLGRINPLNYVNSLARNSVGAGLIMNPTLGPLYYGPKLYSSKTGLAVGAGLGAAGPLGNVLDTSYRHTPIQRDPGMFGRGLRTQDVLRRGSRALR